MNNTAYIDGKYRNYDMIIGSVLIELSDTPVKGYTRELKDDTGIPSYSRYINADIDAVVEYYKAKGATVIKRYIADEYDYTEIRLMAENIDGR